MELVTKRDMDDAEKLGEELGLTDGFQPIEIDSAGWWEEMRHDIAQAIADGRRLDSATAGISETVSPDGLRARARMLRERGEPNDSGSTARHLELAAIELERRAMHPLRCVACDDYVREIAQMADLVAFWAYQAKCYYARAAGLGEYDSLPPAHQQHMDVMFEEVRAAENRERIGYVPPAHDIGS